MEMDDDNIELDPNQLYSINFLEEILPKLIKKKNDNKINIDGDSINFIDRSYYKIIEEKFEDKLLELAKQDKLLKSATKDKSNKFVNFEKTALELAKQDIKSNTIINLIDDKYKDLRAALNKVTSAGTKPISYHNIEISYKSIDERTKIRELHIQINRAAKRKTYTDSTPSSSKRKK